MMQGWYYVKSLTGQRHDRVQLKANNCNRGQLFRPYWVSSARRSKLYEVFSWLTDIHILTMRWWWPQMELESKFLPIGQCHMQNAYQSTGWILHIACYAVLTRPNKVETAVHGCNCWLSVGLYHVVVPLSFLRSISLASLFAILSIFGWSDLLQIQRKQAAFSFAILCIIMLHCPLIAHFPEPFI